MLGQSGNNRYTSPDTLRQRGIWRTCVWQARYMKKSKASARKRSILYTWNSESNGREKGREESAAQNGCPRVACGIPYLDDEGDWSYLQKHIIFLLAMVQIFIYKLILQRIIYFYIQKLTFISLYLY